MPINFVSWQAQASLLMNGDCCTLVRKVHLICLTPMNRTKFIRGTEYQYNRNNISAKDITLCKMILNVEQRTVPYI